jgi:exodeoxyribonuclease VII large subunit
MQNRLLGKRALLDRRSASLEALSPLAILNRGYAVVFDSQGKLLKDAGEVRKGEEISARLARGRVRALVTASEPPESKDSAVE